MSLEPSTNPLFVTTRWSIVLAARGGADADSALETLCKVYWYPLYAFVRSRGHSPADAQDLTQGFFAQLLAHDYLQAVQPDRGRFRTFLRMALQRFMANEWDREQARKRGGGQVHVPIDTVIAEQRLRDEGRSQTPPDLGYDRRWALALLDDAALRLEREYLAGGKAIEFTALKPHLTAGRARFLTRRWPLRWGQARARPGWRSIGCGGGSASASGRPWPIPLADADGVEAEMRDVLAALGGR